MSNTKSNMSLILKIVIAVATAILGAFGADASGLI